MTGYDNERRGVLFRNTRKRDGKRDPDYTVNATINGVEYWLDGWLDTPKGGGDKYLSLKFREKEQQAATPSPAQPPESFDDDLPF
jgi:hypothetical protein